MKRATSLVLLVWLAAAATWTGAASAQTAADPRPTLKVGSAVASRGQKVTGVIAVPAGFGATSGTRDSSVRRHGGGVFRRIPSNQADRRQRVKRFIGAEIRVG